MKFPMFPFIFIFLNFLFINFLFSQGWERRYRYCDSVSAMYTWGNRIVTQGNDEGFYIAGYGNKDAALIHVSSTGDSIWTKNFGNSDSNYYFSAFYFICGTMDGGQILAGDFAFNPNPGKVVRKKYIVKTDQNGDTLWTKFFNMENPSDWASPIQQTPDSSYVFAFSTADTSKPFLPRTTHLYKLKSNGDTIWTKKYGGNNYSLQLVTASQTTDGGCILSGNYYINGSGSNFHPFFLLKTDANGDSLWTKIYGGGTQTFTPNSIVQTSDSGFAIAGNSFDSIFANFNNDINIFLLRTDKQGDSLWTKNFGGSSYDEGASIVNTTDNGFVITGTTCSFGDTLGDMFLLKTNSNGDSIWFKTYGDTLDEYASSLIQTNDGEFLIAGFVNWNCGDIFLVKTDSLGSVSNGSLSINKNKFSVFPNPTSGKFTVSMGSQKAKSFSVVVYNLFGEIILEKEIIGRESEFNLSNQLAGIYFLKFESDGKRFVKKIIKE